MDIRFSVIIPVYNIENFIKQSIESVLNQSYNNYEIILVNDGSTDKSKSICDSYSDKYSFIKTIHKTNGGLSSARNVGIKAAVGDYLMFLDGDDFLSQDALMNFKDIIVKSPDVEIVIGKMIKYYSNQTRIVESFTYPDEYNRLGGREVLEKLFKDIPVIIWSACRSIYSRKFFQENKFYFKEGITSEDLELIPKVFLRAKKIEINNIPFYYYRLGRINSIINVVNPKRFQDIMDIIDGYFVLLNEIDLYHSSLGKAFIEQLANVYSRYLLLTHQLPKEYRNDILNAMLKNKDLLEYSTNVRGKYLRFLNTIISFKFKIYLYHLIKKNYYFIKNR